MVQILTMQEVSVAILVVLVAGVFSLPLDYEMDYPLDHSAQMRSAKKPQPELRIGLVNPRYLWPDATMYYTIDPDYSHAEKNFILGAIAEIERNTCVKIKPHSGENNFVRIRSVPGEGCRSKNGMYGGAQDVKLEKRKCFHPKVGHGIVVHELLHALGLLHTHTAHNRDHYVQVFLNNVRDENIGDFDKVPETYASDFGFGYDYSSVMHYDKFDFAKDKSKPTILAKPNPDTPIGQRVGMSVGDINKINYMYHC